MGDRLRSGSRNTRLALAQGRGVTLLEVVIAVAILAACLAPMLDLFGTSGTAVQKSQNLSTAVGLAHKIAQHLMAMSYDEVVDRAEAPLADGTTDTMFNPLENPGTNMASALRITAAQMPEYHGFIKKFDVRYSLDVVGDQPKDVKILIHWKEGGRDLLYTLQVYVAKH